ncbi:hypothetical protein F2Q69_00013071 [Brassica cretica]|uniref:Uncharacterized protein n=1 Tax=Brassica cretica TaxID=69181 RepID=A0A8S9QSH9_BRACR|nr:hypothetical protein F2Q69_00013071 [Brassica cretica]
MMKQINNEQKLLGKGHTFFRWQMEQIISSCNKRTVPAHQQRKSLGPVWNQKILLEEKDEYGVYRDDQGCTRDVDGHIINVSKDDIKKLMERASRDEHIYICLPEHASSFSQTKLVPEIYTKDEINEMFYGVCGAQEKYEGDFQMKLDGVYYPLNDSIRWLTTCMEEMREIVEIQSYIARRPDASASIDRRNKKSTDIHRQKSVDEATNRGLLVPKVTSDMSDTHNQGEEISADTYATLRRHQFNLESLGDRLQKMENTTATIKENGAEEMKQYEISLVHG